MNRIYKITQYTFIYTWLIVKCRHIFRMFFPFHKRIFENFSFNFWSIKGTGNFKLFRNITNHLTIFFSLSLSDVFSFKCKTMIYISKIFSSGFSSFRIINPLCFDSFTSMTNRDSRIIENLRYCSIVDSPKITKFPVRKLLVNIPKFSGIFNIHTFDRFYSFYDFLRKTFFHCRYVLVIDKELIKSKTSVYNLSVKNDESYVIPTGIVHNCRCTVVQVRKEKYPESDEQKSIDLGSQATAGKHQEMFKFNPGKNMTTFPAYNAYTIRKCNNCKFNGSLNLSADISDNELCEACIIIRENAPYTTIPTERGKVRIHSGHGKKERKENIEIATYLANKHEYVIDLLDNPNNITSADSYNHTLKFKQEYKVNRTATKNSIDTLIRDAKRQANNIVLRIDSDIPLGILRDGITDRVRRSKNIENITVIINGKDVNYSRNEILKDDFKIKQEDFN